jgi:WD40 repeat protein
MKYSFALIFLIVFLNLSFSQVPEFEWANQCGNPPNTTDTKTTLASGQDGNFFISGEFLDTAQFGDKFLVSAGGTDIFLVKNTAEGVPLWTSRIGAADYDYVQKIITDEEGNVMMTGYFYGDTQIGQDQYTSYGSQDLFIAKFNAGGAFLWSYRVGGPMADYITGLSLDTDQNIVIAGYFYNEISFGDTTILASSSSDIYVAKFDPEGNLLWVTSAGGSSSDQVRSASFDPDGNILITGSFYYDITLGDTTLSTFDPVGVFIARYFSDGQLDQVFQLNGTYLSTENYVVAGQDGDFYVSGNFSEQIFLGCNTFDAGEFNQDIFVAKYNASCDFQWARHAFSSSSDQIIGIVTDPDNNLYLTGHYLDTIQFDQLIMPYNLCCGSREIFIVKYNSTGDVQWGDSISGTRANVQSIAMSDQGELLLSGLFTEEVRMDPLKLSSFNGFQNYVTCLHTGILAKVDQIDAIRRIKVFPNPATDQIRIIDQFKSSVLYYKIFTGSGSQVISGTIGADENIDVGFLSAGQYLLQLFDPEEDTFHTCLFIKQ